MRELSEGTQWAAGNIGLKLRNENGGNRLGSDQPEDVSDRQRAEETAWRQAVRLYTERENMVPALTTNTKSRFDIDLKAVYAPVHISIATPKQSESSALITGREHTQMAAVFHKSTSAGYSPHHAGHGEWTRLSPFSAYFSLTLNPPPHTTPKAIMRAARMTQLPNPKTLCEPPRLAFLGQSMSLAIPFGSSFGKQRLLASSACCVEVLPKQSHGTWHCPHSPEQWENRFGGGVMQLSKTF